MSDTNTAVTRGHGYLEGFLARKRAARANALIPDANRGGAILDIGCGSYPYFLVGTRFSKKVGVDQTVDGQKTITPDDGPPVVLHAADLHALERLPFEDASFDAVTMLAVFEHLRPARLPALLSDVARVLRPGGVFVMTTPSGWTGPVLEVLKRVGAVSADEIDEHEDAYSRKRILEIIGRSALADMPTESGYFELGANVWVRVTRPEA